MTGTIVFKIFCQDIVNCEYDFLHIESHKKVQLSTLGQVRRIKILFSLPQVKGMVQGHDRRPELGYMLARECRKMVSYPAQNKNSKTN